MHHLDAARVGARLRELRRSADLSQNRLEALSGVSQRRISRYENGHVMPTIQTLDRLVAVLGYTLSETFKGLT